MKRDMPNVTLSAASSSKRDINKLFHAFSDWVHSTGYKGSYMTTSSYEFPHLMKKLRALVEKRPATLEWVSVEENS